jgi:predicted Rossmann fold flavoprotein
LITGHGRCNLTNAVSGREFFERIGTRQSSFLRKAFERFGTADAMEFFEKRGVKLKVEDSNRVFPASDRAGDILDALERYLRAGRVEIRLGAEVVRFVEHGGQIASVKLQGGETIIAERFIFATGGKSYPMLGAKGDGYKWAEKLGHKITDLHPSLSPILVKGVSLGLFEGAPLPQVEIALIDESGHVLSRATGNGIITALGFSGPVAHDLAKQISVAQRAGRSLRLQINFQPGVSIDAELRRRFETRGSLMIKSALDKLVPPKILPEIIRQSGIDPELFGSRISKAQRQVLARLIGSWEFAVKGVVGFDKAITTSGGVDLDQVDPATMGSRLVNNLYFAGEVLDLDGPSGGFNLQLCWTTGFVAGEGSTKP